MARSIAARLGFAGRKGANFASTALFGMSDADFRGPDIDLRYAIARILAQWLDARRAL
jgi:hypothetical protein